MKSKNWIKLLSTTHSKTKEKHLSPQNNFKFSLLTQMGIFNKKNSKCFGLCWIWNLKISERDLWEEKLLIFTTARRQLNITVSFIDNFPGIMEFQLFMQTNPRVKSCLK
jgi:hypothetical protein